MWVIKLQSKSDKRYYIETFWQPISKQSSRHLTTWTFLVWAYFDKLNWKGTGQIKSDLLLNENCVSANWPMKSELSIWYYQFHSVVSRMTFWLSELLKYWLILCSVLIFCINVVLVCRQTKIACHNKYQKHLGSYESAPVEPHKIKGCTCKNSKKSSRSDHEPWSKSWTIDTAVSTSTVLWSWFCWRKNSYQIILVFFVSCCHNPMCTTSRNSFIKVLTVHFSHFPVVACSCSTSE